MSDQSPFNDTQPESLDRREARRQRRAARHDAFGTPSSGSAWVAGLILILLGVAFLMQNMGTFSIPLKNWWALFILIPAIGAFDTAVRMYRNADNQLTAPARGSLLFGLVLTLVTVSFLFNLNWTIFGPLLIILTGIGLVINTMLPGNKSGRN
jgi:peptidoglycan/LPS O-acetylase OafA/YrhL